LEVRCFFLRCYRKPKKKELLGEFYRDGVIDAQEAIAVNDHDFGSAGSGVVIPHGIYDVGLNRGYVHLNTSHDTSELACDSLCPSLTPGGPATSSKRSRSGCGPPGPALAGPGEWGYAPHTTGEACAREPWLTRARPGCGCWGRSWRIGCACAGGDARGQKREARACYLGPLLRHLDKEIP
jgi:hypothetical protein